MNDVAVLIRLCYYPESKKHTDESIAWRFDWFQRQVLPRLFAQEGDIPFDVWVWAHPRHAAEIEAMDPRIRTFTVNSTPAHLEGTHPWTQVKGLPRYPIQLRLDSDDLVAARYVARALEALNSVPRRHRALAHFQPYKVDIETGLTYWCAPGYGKGAYGPKKISAFCALRQPTAHPRYSWVYGVGHTELWRFADRVVAIEEGHCWAACHSHNDSTEVYPYDTAIGRLELAR